MGGNYGLLLSRSNRQRHRRRKAECIEVEVSKETLRRWIIVRTVKQFEKETNNVKAPMSNWVRVIIETDEKNPKLLAVITNDDCETTDGLRVRLKPSKED